MTANGSALKTVPCLAPSLVEIVPVERVEITVAPWQWEFAVKRRAEIDAHFAVRSERQPALWNGRVILLKDYRIEKGMLQRLGLRDRFRELCGLARLELS